VNQSASVGDVITLDGSGSLDADGRPLAFHWSLLSAPAGVMAVLEDPTSVMNPVFRVIAAGTYVFQLVVSDGTLTSAPATVTVSTVDAVPVAMAGQTRTDGDATNAEPVANAGANQSVFTGAMVALDAAATTDPDGDVLSFAWALLTAPAGSNAALSASTGILSSFAADVAGSYTIQLTANDGQLSSSTTIVVVAVDPAMPTSSEIQAVVAGINSLPASAFVDSAAPRALTSSLDAVRRHVASGDFATALAILDKVITACQAQNRISADLMLLRTELVGLVGGR
jgi:hypothetical protein